MRGIDPFRRYQVGLALADLFPAVESRVCRCGCGAALPPRRRSWATDACVTRAVRTLLVVKGDTGAIRAALLARDGGVCRACGVECGPKEWQADHIVPVHQGGGGCGLDGFQTLCRWCHTSKSGLEASARASSPGVG